MEYDDCIACITKDETKYGIESELILSIDGMNTFPSNCGNLDTQSMQKNSCMPCRVAKSVHSHAESVTTMDSTRVEIGDIDERSECSVGVTSEVPNTLPSSNNSEWNWRLHYTSNFMNTNDTSFADYLAKAVIKPHFNEMGLAKLFPFGDIDTEITRNTLFQKHDRKMHYEILYNVEGAFDILLSQLSFRWTMDRSDLLIVNKKILLQWLDSPLILSTIGNALRLMRHIRLDSICDVFLNRIKMEIFISKLLCDLEEVYLTDWLQYVCEVNQLDSERIEILENVHLKLRQPNGHTQLDNSM
jgi:hypothetical protein